VAQDISPIDRQRMCEFEVVKSSIENLKTFPWIRTRVESGELRLHGAWFDVRFGQLMLLQPDGTFAMQDSATTI
jgi:carbonic anhydrase